MFTEILIIVLCLLLTWRRWRLRGMMKLANQLKSDFPCLPLLGHSYLLIGNAERRMETIKSCGREAIKQGGAIGVWHANRLYIMVADADIAECVLKNCLQKDQIMRLMHDVIGNGHIYAPVLIWRARRKINVPIFSTKNLKSSLCILNEQSNVLVDILQSRVGKGDFSIWNHATTYTMDSISEATLGVNIGTQKNPEHPFLLAIENFTNLFALRACQPWLHSDFIYQKTTYYRTLLKHKKYVTEFINKNISDTRKSMKQQEENKLSSESHKDCLRSFLKLLIESSGGDNGYTDLELLEEVLVIIIAGADTSAVGISFMTVMLSKHLDVQEKVYQEILDLFGDSDRAIEAEDLNRLRYLDAFVKETLRLYPPVSIVVRSVERDTELPTGVTLLEGCGVVVNFWAINQNPKYWGDDADLFRPERFIDDSLKNPSAFMPFSTAPRGCMGYQYAMMSMKTALIALLRRYRVLPAADNSDDKSINVPLRVKLDMLLRHVDNYMVKLEQRN